MRCEQARELADQALNELALALDDGQGESLEAFLRVMGRFHRYSVGNQLLIALARPDATRIAGYRTWQKMGRQVREGEQGISIIAPMVMRKKRGDGGSAKADVARSDNAGGQTDSDNETVMSFRGATVFDIAQTDGAPLPQFATVRGNPAEYLERLEAFVADRGIRLERRASLGGAEGMSTGGAIVLRSDLTPAEAFSALCHETAHEILHKGDDDRHTTRTVRETEAEAVAFVVSQAIGLDTNSAASDYIQLYDGTKATLLASLDRIRRTAIEILDGIGAGRADVITEASQPEQLPAQRAAA